MTNKSDYSFITNIRKMPKKIGSKFPILNSRSFCIITSIILCWLIISLYFFNQHQFTVANYKLDQELQVGNLQIIIADVTIRNFEYRQHEKKPWYCSLAARLPSKIQLPFLKLCHFYTRSLSFDENHHIAEARGLIIDTNNGDIINGKLSNLLNIYFKDYSPGLNYTCKTNSNYTLFNTQGMDIPCDSPLQLVIENKINGELKEIAIADNLSKEKCQAKEFPRYITDPATTIIYFFNLIAADKNKEALALLVDNRQENVPVWYVQDWSNLTGHIKNYSIEYIGSYQNYDGVYIFSTSIEESRAKKHEYYIHLINDKNKCWKIIDISPFKYYSPWK